MKLHSKTNPFWWPVDCVRVEDIATLPESRAQQVGSVTLILAEPNHCKNSILHWSFGWPSSNFKPYILFPQFFRKSLTYVYTLKKHDLSHVNGSTSTPAHRGKDGSKADRQESKGVPGPPWDFWVWELAVGTLSEWFVPKFTYVYTIPVGTTREGPVKEINLVDLVGINLLKINIQGPWLPLMGQLRTT